MSDSYHDDDQVLGKAYDARLIKRLVPYARPYLGLVFGGAFFMLLAAACELVTPLIVRDSINGPFTVLGDSGATTAQREAAWGQLGWYAFAFLALVAVQVAARFGDGYLFQILGNKAVLDLRQKTYAHIQQQPLRFFDRNPVGRLVTRVTSDVEAIGEVFASGFVQLAGDAIIIVGALTLMFLLSWQLALIVVLAIPVMGFLTWLFRGRARSAFRDMRVKLAGVNSFLNETIQGWRVTRIFGTEKRMEKRFDDLSSDYREATYRTVFNFSIFFPVVELAGTATVAVVVWWGTSSIFAGTLDFGTFFAFFLYTPMLFRPIREMSEKYNVLQSAMAAAERIFKVMDTRNDVADPASPRSPVITGEIEFRDVWFTYDASKPEPDWVLKGVSFRVPAGSSLALVGATGSGKTTIISLLMRFYDVQKGSILVDGVDIREMTRAHLRRAFSLVLQDVFLFAGSVLDNVRLGDQSISREQVEQACRVVHADTFIRGLAGGYDGMVAERGATFSAGQRQLIAFARALAFDPRVLVLDEATSNIDSETERLIQDALHRLMQGRTAVVVAHRLSTITDSDNILVLHKGEVVEQGSHAQLLARNGRYTKLYQLQFANGRAAQAGVG
ncbi:MAG: ABC transporter ATP-binding protein [Planctomycetes bacterium]|nr:ABC transporter ATP-binding protein [Planctomycetota bacterium]MCL4731387.1 ABC transporter ATP-binding protein/permease [Planctomycetota bacterium]